MPGALIYNRVSTKQQTKSLSLPTQKKECEAYCARNGLQVVKVFSEKGESAKTADRTELRKLLAFCRDNKKQIDFVVVYSLSRFARSTVDHLALRTVLAGLGISLRSVTEPIDDSSTGKLVETVLSAVAQFDNDQKADRTRAGMRHALELGRWTHQAPLGFVPGQKGGPSLLHDEGKAELVRRAFEEFASGKYQQRELLQKLTRWDLRTRRGQRLAPQSLRALLRNRLYAGWVELPKWDISVRGDFEPIVSEAVFDRVQAVLSGRGGAPRRHARDNPDYPLRRFVRCRECGRPLTGSGSMGHSRRYRYYHCTFCGVRVRKEALEDAFRGLLTRLQPRPEYMKLYNAVVVDVWKESRAEVRKARARLERRVAELRQREDRLEEAFIHRREIDRQTYERQRDKLREQVMLAEVELAEATGEELDVEGVLAFAQHVLTNAARLWEQAPLDQRQRLQAVLFPKGLTSDGSGFGTPVTCLAFSELPSSDGAQDGLASPTGFEPVSPP